MPYFKVNSLKTVLFDADFLDMALSVGWRPTDRNSALIVDNFIRNGRGDWPLGWDYILEGSLSIDIRADGRMFLSGLQAKTKEELATPSSDTQRIVDAREPFSRSGLNIDQVRSLQPWVGYPIVLHVSGFQYSDWELRGVIRIFWSIFDTEETETTAFRIFSGSDYYAIRGNHVVTAWLGQLSASSSEYQLLNSDGTPLIWPDTLSIFAGSRGADSLSQSDVDAAPGWVQLGPNRNGFVAESFDDQTFEDYPSGAFYGLFRDRAGEAATTYINGVRRVEIITNPGRLDSDGTIQPQPFPPELRSGSIPLATPISAMGTPNRTSQFQARVVSSQVTPEIIDQFTGFIAERSRHVLVLDVPDRSAAGLQSTPMSLLSSTGPLYEIEGIEYYLTEMIEEVDNSALLTMSTAPDG